MFMLLAIEPSGMRGDIVKKDKLDQLDQPRLMGKLMLGQPAFERAQMLLSLLLSVPIASYGFARVFSTDTGSIAVSILDRYSTNAFGSASVLAAYALAATTVSRSLTGSMDETTTTGAA